MCSQHVHVCTTKKMTITLCVCVPGFCQSLRSMLTWWLCLRENEEELAAIMLRLSLPGKEWLLLTPENSVSWAQRTVREEVASSCSEEVTLHSELETNQKLKNSEQYGSFYLVDRTHYLSTSALTPSSSSLVIHRTGLHTLLSTYRSLLLPNGIESRKMQICKS